VRPLPGTGASAFFLVLVLGVSAPANAEDFTKVSPMVRPRLNHTATTTPGDQILVAGGCVTEDTLGECAARTDETEIFDLGLKGFFLGPKMSEVRMQHTATALKSGDVIVIGGCKEVGGTPTNPGYPPRSGCQTTGTPVDLYNAGSKTIALVQPGLVEARNNHTATLILGGSQDGKVLVTGGFGSTIYDNNLKFYYANARRTAELYDPSSKTFTKTAGDMVHARAMHTATLLVTGQMAGKILITGGLPLTEWPVKSQKTAELFDPATGTFAATADMLNPYYAHTATRLPDGRVLIAGYASATEIFDPVTLTFSAGPVQGNGPHDRAALLGAPVDSVLFVGDTAPEIFDPVASTMRSTGFGGIPFNPEIALLSRGRALVVGGQANAIAPPMKLAFLFELTEPGGSCMRATDCRLLSCIDGTCCKKGCNVPCGSCDVPDGACKKVTGRDHPSCTGTSAEDLRTCDAQAACKKKQGVFCDQADLCITGFCSDGFCCESACSASCVACDFPTPGLCVGVAPQPVNGRPRCPAGQFCSGSGPDCVPAYCDGDHTLRRPRRPDLDCSPYRCQNSGSCFDKCTSVDQCAAPNVCDASGKCIPMNAGDGGCSLGGERLEVWALSVLAALVLARRLKNRREERRWESRRTS